MFLTKRNAEKLVMLVLLGLTGVAGVAFRTEAAEKPTGKLPEQAKAILDNADKIEVIAINCRSKDKGTFHGYEVLGATSINKEERRNLVAFILDGIDKFKGVPAYLWFPRFGVRVWQQEKTVDLVFCFEASQVLVYRNPDAPANVFTANNAERLLENLLKQAKVPIPPKCE